MGTSALIISGPLSPKPKVLLSESTEGGTLYEFPSLLYLTLSTNTSTRKYLEFLCSSLSKEWHRWKCRQGCIVQRS